MKLNTQNLLCVFLLAITSMHAGPAQSADIAIQGGKVFTVTDDEMLENVTILVSDGVVQDIVSGTAGIPEGYTRVDATGKFVTPGIVESHSQFGLGEINLESTTRDDVVREYTFGPAFDVQYGFSPVSTRIPVNRVEGVTRAVVAPTPGNDPLAGWGLLMRLTDTSAVTQTRSAMFGALTDSVAEFVGGARGVVIQRLRRAFTMAKRYQPNRYDPASSDYDHADMAALKRFLGSGKPLVLEVHRSAEIRAAVDLANDFDVPLILLGASEAWTQAELLATNNVPVVIDVFANLPTSFERLLVRDDALNLLEAAGVTVLITSDETENARWLRHLAGNAVANGMSWSAALRAITATPAQVWGFPDGVGQIKVGGVADIVIWNGDPLETHTWAEQVMIDGVWQSSETRQTRLLERYRNLEVPQNIPYQ